ncbi:hypothetical protein [Serratia marcescens]|uniref:hypothetical protein n=1 Tax=Serratia marcescens TaxID=615 RepID=UPI0034E8E387
MSIVADTVIQFNLSRNPVGATNVIYADGSVDGGNGGLRDSDATLSTEKYIYQSGTGQPSVANIPALVNKPYQLYNWCVAHNIQAGIM